MRLLAWGEDTDLSSRHPYMLVFELLEEGSLADWLRGPGGEAAKKGTLSAIALVEVVEASIGARTQDDVNAACRPAVSDGSAPETNWVT